MTRLVALALRRTLPAWSLALLVGLTAFSACASRGASLVELAADRAGGARALARENVWSLLLALSPLVLFRAARLGTATERAWLAATPARAGHLFAALALGCVLAAGLAAGWTAVAAEIAAGSAGGAWRRVARLENPPAVLSDDLPRLTWRVRAPSPGERLRLRVTLAPGSGPTVAVRLVARGSAGETAAEARVAGRTALELVPPASGGGELELALERAGPGALLVLPAGALEVLEPVASERFSALALGAHAWLTLGVGCVLALGLGRHLRPAIAAALVCALAWVGSTLRGSPTAALRGAWGELALGLVPRAPGALELSLALALMVVGLLVDSSWSMRTVGMERRRSA